MFPSPAFNNGLDSAHGNTEMRCYFLERKFFDKTHISDLPNRIIIQFRPCMVCTVRTVSTTFLKHICRIICGSAKEKMIWVDARRVVTLMTHKQKAVSNWAISKFVTNSMGKPFRATSNTKKPITVRSKRPLPDPTFFRFGFSDLFPKPFFCRFFASRHARSYLGKKGRSATFAASFSRRITSGKFTLTNGADSTRLWHTAHPFMCCHALGDSSHARAFCV